MPVSWAARFCVPMCREFAVLFTIVTGEVAMQLPFAPLMQSFTCTSYRVPIPVFVTIPFTGKVIDPPLIDGVPHAFEMLMLQTGNRPNRKSLRTALVDADERVSSIKLAKQGRVPPTAAKAAVISTPPSKNSGDARLLLLYPLAVVAHVALTELPLVMAQ